MSVLQPSHNTASPTDFKASLFSIITPALRICFDFAYSIQYLLTLTVSFLLSHGLYASKAIAVNFYHASRIFLVNLQHTLVFLSINIFYASEIIISKSLEILRLLAIKGTQHGNTMLARGMVTAAFAARNLWKRTEKARARIFFEFMVWILHPSPLIMLVFWPGWIFVFGGYVYLYYC